MNFKRGNTPGIIRDNKPGNIRGNKPHHHELQER
jgi:hypothetical protein